MEIGILLIPDAPASVVTGLLDFFSLVGIDDRGRRSLPACSVHTIAFQSDPVPLNGGVSIAPQKIGRSGHRFDLVIVPALGPHVLGVGRRLGMEVEWIRETARSGSRVASVCTGAFLLAETGLLDDRSATTHWLFAPVFRRRFPRVDLDIDRLVIDTGQFLTSGGSNSFYDLALHIVEQELGRETALTTARHLLLDTDRVSQTPFMAFSSQKHHRDDLVRRAQTILEEEFRSAVSIEGLASRVGMSDRSFKRRFKKATGDAPSVYLQRLRMEDARRRLSDTDETIEEISYAVGYESVGFFRSVFKRHAGASPNEYRRRHGVRQGIR